MHEVIFYIFNNIILLIYSQKLINFNRWTADGRALAVAWCGGGVSIWSTFGGLLMCSLGWDYGLNADLSKCNPLNVHSLVNTFLLCIIKIYRRLTYLFLQ